MKAKLDGDRLIDQQVLLKGEPAPRNPNWKNNIFLGSLPLKHLERFNRKPPGSYGICSLINNLAVWIH
ncbi:MAG: hypothetical protein P1P83_02130 [Bacteroidales bacterium]|nr:hypothetical protein [Bacteroidales bacterium]MDT8373109.1 hypothetical protein [Bacteroidales bacterium]